MRCSQHAGALAGWRCEACARALCVDCATGSLEAPACATCGRLVEVLRAPRAIVAPFARTWRTAARTVCSARGVGQVLVGAAVLQGLVALGRQHWFLGRALELGWVLYLARRASVGFDAFGLPRTADLVSVWRGPLLRVLGGTGLVLLGAALLVSAGAREAHGAWPWVLAVASVALAPPSLVLASVEGPGAAVPTPTSLLATWRRFHGALAPIAVGVALCAGLEVLTAHQAPFSLDDTQLDRALLRAFVPHLVSLFALAFAAVLAGHVVFTHASELGHHVEDLLPVVDTPPRGARLPSVDVQAADHARAQRFAPIELVEGDDLAAALDARDVDRALLAFGAVPRAAARLDAARALTLGQMLAAAGEAAQAAAVLHAAIGRTGPGDTQARAMVILARVYAEKLGREEEAQALFREVLAKYPGTEAARFAASRVA